MNFLEILLSRRRMVLTAVLILSGMGLVAWFSMPRQEDPTMPDYWGNVVAIFPGANAEKVERLILEPMEEHLAEVDAIRHWEATAQADQAFIHIELRSNIHNVEEVWDEVEEKLEEAARDFPDGAQLLDLDTDLNDQEAIVIAISGTVNIMDLSRAANHAKKKLLALPEVSEVRLIADPEEQITVTFDDIQVHKLGLTPENLAGQLQSRNSSLPGGTIKLSGRTVNLTPHTEFLTLEEIRETPILLPNGEQIPLSEIASIYRGPEEPTKAFMRFNQSIAVGLGIIPQKNVHLVQFGESVRSEIAKLSQDFPELSLEEVAYLPKRVQTRLNELGKSLVMGVLIVAGILLLAMGVRLGLVVAAVVPLVAFSSLSLFAGAGGVLHQISIAALVIALGMLVDNAIVVAENIQWRIDQGEPPHQAALASVKELAAPLGSATATTLAAFVPMLINQGVTAEFTRSLPVVIMLTLTVSYFFAIFVTPSLSEIFLRKKQPQKQKRTTRFAQNLARLSIRRPGLILSSALVMVLASSLGSGLVRKQFFPSSDRNQVLVEIKLPEGAHLDETSKVCLQIEREFQNHSEILAMTSFIGRSVPHFYYNLSQIPWKPHFAQILISTKDLASLPIVISHIREFARKEITSAMVIPRKLEQGPPIDTPIEVRLYGDSFEVLNENANLILKELRAIEGAIDSRHDLSLGAPNLNFQVNDAAASRHGLTRAHVATSLFGRTRGLPVGQFRSGEDPIPVLLRSSKGENLGSEELETLLITGPGAETVPLSALTNISLDWRPAAIKHRNRTRVVHISAQLAEGFAFSQVQKELESRLGKLEFPSTVHYEFGGEAEGSGEANSSMVEALPWGLILLFAILLAQFNSFRRVSIILITVPLAATGVIPGLLLGGQPFGFMSFLGVIALVGVVVNNAIVLLDVVESLRKEGMALEEALQESVMRRVRPILLTTATTVAGLTPLALSDSTLWPPLALAMISGLIASTLLTLLVVPALYYLLFKPGIFPRVPFTLRARPAVSLVLLVCATLNLRAQPSPDLVSDSAPISLSWQDILQKAATRPVNAANQDRALAIVASAEGFYSQAKLPQLWVHGSTSYSDPVASLETPLGKFVLGERRQSSGSLMASQPLLDFATKRSGDALSAQASALFAHAESRILHAKQEAIAALILVAALEAQQRVNQAFIESLTERLSESGVLVEAGSVLEADRLKVALQLDQATHEDFLLKEEILHARYLLGKALGMSTPVQPELSNLKLPGQIPSMDQALQLALNTRPELKALHAEVEAQNKQVLSIDAEKLPKLTLNAGWTFTDGEAFRASSGFEASLAMNWRPFSGGLRKARKAGARLNGQAFQKELVDMELAIRLEIRRIFSDLAIAENAQTVAQSAVSMANETLRVERQRHAVGKATTNDLLEAETLKKQRDIDLELAQLNLFRHALRLQVAVGK